MDGKFALVVFIVSILFATTGIISGKVLENVFPKLNASKGKPVIYIESMVQIGTIALITYGFRIIIDNLIQRYFKTDKFKQADKFAVIVAAPTIFLLQDSLKNKLKFLLN